MSNHVYLMAYENVKVEHINKKTIEEEKINLSKCVLALRTKDFANKQQMEEHFKKFKFQNIAFHDLEGLLELDMKDAQINNKER